MTPAPQPAGLFRQHASTVGGPMPWVGASGIKGVQSIRVRLGRADSSPRNYTVRLYFAEPEDLHEGERRFNVAIQGRNVLQEFDIVAAAGGAHRSVVKKFKRVSVTDDLTIRLTPDGERPAVLCGLEVVAE